MPIRLAGPIALCLLAGLVAGCGGEPPTTVENRTIRVTLDEYAISPRELEAPAGELRIEARNVGRLTHNVAIRTMPRDPKAARTRRRIPTLQPGEEATSRPIRLRPGTYRLVCTIANHGVLGEHGTLVVK